MNINHILTVYYQPMVDMDHSKAQADSRRLAPCG